MDQGESAREFEIYIPTVDESGAPFPGEIAARFKKKLIARFGGLTDTRHRNQGLWKVGSFVMRDEIVIWRVLTGDAEGVKYFTQLKAELEQEFAQEKILIVARDVRVL